MLLSKRVQRVEKGLWWRSGSDDKREQGNMSMCIGETQIRLLPQGGFYRPNRKKEVVQ